MPKIGAASDGVGDSVSILIQQKYIACDQIGRLLRQWKPRLRHENFSHHLDRPGAVVHRRGGALDAAGEWRAAACVRDAARAGAGDAVSAGAGISVLYAVPQTRGAAAAGGRADSWLHRRSRADERARTTTGGERLRGAGDRRKRARRESESVQWRRGCERQSARERKDRGRLSSRQSAGRRIANRRDGAFDGRGRRARLRDARPEYQRRGDDFGRLGTRSRAPEGCAVHFCRARSAGADPGHVHGACGSSGGCRADRSRQDLRRLHAGQRGRSD